MLVGFALAVDYRAAIVGGGLAKPRLVYGAALGVLTVIAGAQSSCPVVARASYFAAVDDFTGGGNRAFLVC